MKRSKCSIAPLELAVSLRLQYRSDLVRTRDCIFCEQSDAAFPASPFQMDDTA